MSRRTENGKAVKTAVPTRNRESLDEMKHRLGFSETGLTKAVVEKRLGEYGYNEIPEHKQNPLLKFLSYFWGPIPWMIEAAVVLSAIVRHWADLAIIGVLPVATIIAIFGVFMAPIGWTWAAFVLGYALAWFLINDLLMQGVYRVFSSGHPGLLGARARRS